MAALRRLLWPPPRLPPPCSPHHPAPGPWGRPAGTAPGPPGRPFSCREEDEGAVAEAAWRRRRRWRELSFAAAAGGGLVGLVCYQLYGDPRADSARAPGPWLPSESAAAEPEDPPGGGGLLPIPVAAAKETSCMTRKSSRKILARQGEFFESPHSESWDSVVSYPYSFCILFFPPLKTFISLVFENFRIMSFDMSIFSLLSFFAFLVLVCLHLLRDSFILHFVLNINLAYKLTCNCYENNITDGSEQEMELCRKLRPRQIKESQEGRGSQQKIALSHLYMTTGCHVPHVSCGFSERAVSRYSWNPGGLDFKTFMGTGDKTLEKAISNLEDNFEELHRIIPEQFLEGTQTLILRFRKHKQTFLRTIYVSKGQRRRVALGLVFWTEWYVSPQNSYAEAITPLLGLIVKSVPLYFSVPSCVMWKNTQLGVLTPEFWSQTISCLCGPD
ncbi:hypothetical protein FD754_017319 [Muntiacus muntjak]|uniref:Uncharacterized protein n=1 Tax=Muntiacus muntjak TaxID=9888 RepID=A0A5N3VTH8_MUNMU|nr:hypothetical protein FD754_017319 [Muntiacus muntjak]